MLDQYTSRRAKQLKQMICAIFYNSNIILDIQN